MEGPNITKQDELDLALRQLRDIFLQNQEKIRLDLEKDCERLKEGQNENAEVLHNKITCQVQTLEKIGSNLKTLDEMILDVECSQVQFGDEVVNELKKKIDELSSGRLTEEDQDRILKEIQETIKSEVEQLVVNVKAL
ncbi:charged multivesicular body protein 6-like isoform X1 [Acropora millepora]|uniref:charged multivesicular body protein 6-like isoform X1 n=1 Tax=Acropora millepora TaxID=45264 RepID=UPI001CF59F8F|nr:charged multivesicular body protein 6-like isoform X1 [Acropora millepora]